MSDRSAAKGVAGLVSSGVVDCTPAALAAFLRKHEIELDKTQARCSVRFLQSYLRRVLAAAAQQSCSVPE